MDLENITYDDIVVGGTRVMGISGDAVFRSGNEVTGTAAFSTQIIRHKDNPHSISFDAVVKDVPEPTGVIGAGIAVTMMAACASVQNKTPNLVREQSGIEFNLVLSASNC